MCQRHGKATFLLSVTSCRLENPAWTSRYGKTSLMRISTLGRRHASFAGAERQHGFLHNRRVGREPIGDRPDGLVAQGGFPDVHDAQDGSARRRAVAGGAWPRLHGQDARARSGAGDRVLRAYGYGFPQGYGAGVFLQDRGRSGHRARRGRHEGGVCGQPVRGAGPEAARPDRLPHAPHVLAR